MWKATATKFGIDRRHCPPPLFVGSRVIDKGCDSRFTALSLKDSRQNGGGGGGDGFFVFVTVHRSFRNARAQSVCLSLSSILIGGRCIQSSNAYLSLIRLDSIARWFAGNLNTILGNFIKSGIFFFFSSTERIFSRLDYIVSAVELLENLYK